MKDMALKLDMGMSNFGHYENDRNVPPSDTLNKIALILDVSTDFLLGSNDNIVDKPMPLTVDHDVEINELMEQSYKQLKDKFSHLEIVEIQTSIMQTFYDLKNKNKKAP